MICEFVCVPAESDAQETRPPDRWSKVAIDFASVIGSCSTGSATAVDNRTRDVTAAAVPSDTQGSRVRM